MIRYYFSLLFLLSFGFPCLAQPNQSQPQLLQSLGKRFPFHHEIIQYLDQIALQHPIITKQVQYGNSYEGRPLQAVVVSSPENIAQLEQIRQSHLGSLGLNQPASTRHPSIPIAWLSYNIHGNEAATASAAIRVIAQLVDTTNQRSQAILKKCIVIIDPCLNPDGYDRYVQGYTQTKGSRFNSHPSAREHQENWPSGRFNHYLFDLNRDWAWQLQQESSTRVAFYQQWMPHIHADFHEMGSNSSYYFPPAARPFHQDITSWQRKFNTIIGQYNSKVFDQQGWLYFTKESFDLFYPSYGDTWPLYNGAIGMTFEQAGSGKAGIALARSEEGDTLTLDQRISHHVATSFATLQATIDHDKQLTSELITFYKKAQTQPTGDYKTYVIKQQTNGGSVRALRQLLDQQGIRYGTVTKKVETKGYNLATQTNEEQCIIEPHDLVISAYQPKSGLLKILFEPQPYLEDSLTYDITAWSLAHAYGVKAYGVSQKISVVTWTNPSKATIPPNSYAYLIPWKSYESLQALSYLHQHQIKVRTSQRPFKIDDQLYEAGTLIITKQGNEKQFTRIPHHLQTLADSLSIPIVATSTGYVEEGMDFGSNAVVTLRAPSVFTVSGNAVQATSLGEVWHFFDEQIRYPLTILELQQWTNFPWSEMDVLILPSGSYQNHLQDRDLQLLKTWIKGGGKLILMENALTNFIGRSEFSLEKKIYRDNSSPEKKYFGNQIRDGLQNETAGSTFKIELDTTHPLAYGYSASYYSLVRENYGLNSLTDGWNVGRLTKDSYQAGFVGHHLKEKLKETLIIGSQKLGQGEIIYLADNPLFRGFWYQGKLLFGNAVFR